MNTQASNHGSGNWVAFLFGAIFNLLVSIGYEGLVEYALYSLVGSVVAGGVWLLYKIIGDRITRPSSSKDKSNEPTVNGKN